MSITIKNVIKYLRGDKGAVKKKEVKKFILSDGFIAFLIVIISLPIGLLLRQKELDTKESRIHNRCCNRKGIWFSKCKICEVSI